MNTTSTLTDRICGVAMMALAALPIAALSTAAHAATVKVSDLNLSTSEGVSAFQARATAASRSFCADERGLTAVVTCRKAVASELAAKMDALRTAQVSKSQSFAAR